MASETHLRYNKKMKRIAGFLIIQKPTEKLLILEKPNGKFDLPKGHVEIAESFLQGAIRECYEETGLTNIRFNPNIFVDHANEISYMRFFFGETPSHKISLTEHKSYYWLDPIVGINLLTNPLQLIAKDLYQKYLIGN